MARTHLHSCIAVMLVCLLPASMLASTALGTVVSDGDFRVNSSLVTGSATLFEGTAVETNRATSRLELDGAWMLLGSNSRARVNRSRIALDRGVGEMGGPRGIELEARSLRIVPGGGIAVARVKLEGKDTVIVGAVNGPVRVMNSEGILVARLKPGTTLSFLPHAAAADSFDITGCLLWKDGHFIIIDPNGQAFVVEGEGLAKLSGNPVHLIGAGAGKQTAGLLTVSVTSITQTASGGCLAAATAENAKLTPPETAQAATPPPPAPEHPVKSGSNTTLIVAGVGIGAAAAVGVVVATSGKKGTS